MTHCMRTKENEEADTLHHREEKTDLKHDLIPEYERAPTRMGTQPTITRAHTYAGILHVELKHFHAKCVKFHLYKLLV
jgi:hypothetical protein